jgi:hypothetical protein
MTAPKTPATKTTTTPAEPKNPATAPKPAVATKKTIARKSDATTKPEFAPVVGDNGRLNHAGCGHPRTMAGRTACRAAHKAAKA